MDINKIIFSRTAPAKKMEIVKNLPRPELLSITPETIVKMIKETGARLYKSRDKQMSLDNSVSNDWNAEFTGVRNYGINPLAEIYLQFENTDTDTSVSLYDFLATGDYRGSILRDDRNGNPRHYYFTFTVQQKAECVRALLLEYINRKYKDKQ